jgi:glutathione S-transferase
MTTKPTAVRLYDSTLASGNTYKVYLLMAHLGLRVPMEELDILATPSRTRLPEFLAKNPNGRIPVIELSDGSYLPESNAIIFYLGEGTRFVPSDPLDRARMLQWMFFEQYSHEPYIAVMKFWTFWGGLHHKTEAELATLKQRGQAALSVMNTHLQGRSYFVAESFTLADIALYAYTHTAHLTGFDMNAVPNVVAWLDRVRGEPGHIAIKSGPGSELR